MQRALRNNRLTTRHNLRLSARGVMRAPHKTPCHASSFILEHAHKYANQVTYMHIKYACMRKYLKVSPKGSGLSFCFVFLSLLFFFFVGKMT